MQNKLKHIHLVITILLLSSCGLFVHRSHKKGDNTAYSQETLDGYVIAKVIKSQLDGCSWQLQLRDGKMLQPSALAPEFQKDQLEVWIKYVPKKGAVGICMQGEMVNITAIKAL